RMTGAPVAGVLPTSAAASCPGVVAHIVSEQVMTTDAKSKAAASLFRLRFIDVFLGFWLLGFHSVRRLFFGDRTNVFLSDKAETAGKTRQVFQPTSRSRGDRFFRTSCSRGRMTPATLPTPQQKLGSSNQGRGAREGCGRAVGRGLGAGGAGKSHRG